MSGTIGQVKLFLCDRYDVHRNVFPQAKTTVSSKKKMQIEVFVCL